MADKKKGFLAGAAVGIGVAAVAAVGVGLQWPSAMAEGRAPLIRASTAPIFAPPPGAPLSFADIFQRVSPAVVSINVTSHVDIAKLRAESPDFGGLPFAIPGAPQGVRPNSRGNNGTGPGETSPKAPKGPEVQASGSGFFISPDGYLVTNNHVIDGAESIKVILNDKTSLTATVVGHDEETDLAVLKVEGRNHPFVTFATGAKPRVGDWVIAVGNPFNLGGTATAGIISAYGRDLQDQSSSFVDYLQIDAPINRGNSGGPTFDVYGNVIGVNTAIYSPSGGSVGIGFAVPANIADRITKELMAGHKITRGYLGVTIQSMTEDLSASLGLAPNQGALVKDVVPGGPSDKAGIQQGDVVLSANGVPVASSQELTRTVSLVKAGEPIHLKVVRSGKTLNIDVRSGVRPSAAQLAAKGGTGGDEEGAAPGSDAPTAPKTTVLGMGIETLTDALRKRLGLADTVHGVIIDTVDEESDAGKKGLSKGDVILKAGDTTVTKPSDVVAAVVEAKKLGRTAVLLFVSRAGNTVFVPVKVEK